MSKENFKTRFKIFLVKDEYFKLSDKDLLKETTKFGGSDGYDIKEIDDLTLYIKRAISTVPSWYSKFLLQEDDTTFNVRVMGLFFKEIEINNKKLKFALTFGSGDSSLEMDKFDNKFGLKTALNLAENFVSLSKNNISTTMSKSKEQANKPMKVTDFIIDIDKDMLSAVSVKPVKNKLTDPKLTGSESLGFTTTATLKNLDQLLKDCYQYYTSDKYKENFSFIDNIEEVTNNSELTSKINALIMKYYGEQDISRVWFGMPDMVELDKVTDYTFEYKKIKRNYDEIDFDSVLRFLDEIPEIIYNIEDFKKIKISINSDTAAYTDVKWTLLDALYASIELENMSYVLSNKRYFNINKEFQNLINEKFNNLPIHSRGLPENKILQKECEYISSICSNDNSLVNMDRKNVIIETAIEICDIFCKDTNTFFHIKKKSSSAVLSHLFAQASTSASIFANSSNGRLKMLDKIFEEDSHKTFSKPQDKILYNVVIAIMVRDKLMENQHANLPFFSKLNLVSHFEKIKLFGFNSVSMLYIYSSAELYKTRRRNLFSDDNF